MLGLFTWFDKSEKRRNILQKGVIVSLYHFKSLFAKSLNVDAPKAMYITMINQKVHNGSRVVIGII